MALSGRCLCGAVRYQTEAGAAFAFNCYCAACRRETGAGHITVVATPSAALTITGALQEVTLLREGGAEPIPRFFCPRCGTTLFARPAMLPTMTMLRAGTLDNPEAIRVERSVYCAQAPSWDQPAAGIPADPTFPNL